MVSLADERPPNVREDLKRGEEMRKTVLLAVLVLITLSVPVFAAQSAQKPCPGVAAGPYIPMYPGAIVVGEVNISEDDILGVVKETIAAFAASKGAPDGANKLEERIAALNLEELTQVICGIQQVRVVRCKLKQPKKQDLRSVVDFYDCAMSKGPWRRIALNLDKPNEASAVYALPGNKGFFAMHTRTVGAGSVLSLARTVGFIDVPKAAAWLRKTLPGLTELAVVIPSVLAPAPPDAGKNPPETPSQ